MNLLGENVRLLYAGLAIAGGEQLTYRSGNEAIDRLEGVPTNPKQDDYGQNGASITSLDLDFIILAENLVIRGKRLKPKRGDQIDRVDEAGNRRTYNVLPRDNDRCYRPTDQTGIMLRVYTVETIANKQ